MTAGPSAACCVDVKPRKSSAESGIDVSARDLCLEGHAFGQALTVGPNLLTVDESSADARDRHQLRRWSAEDGAVRRRDVIKVVARHHENDVVLFEDDPRRVTCEAAGVKDGVRRRSVRLTGGEVKRKPLTRERGWQEVEVRQSPRDGQAQARGSEVQETGVFQTSDRRLENVLGVLQGGCGGGNVELGRHHRMVQRRNRDERCIVSDR